MKRRWAIVGVGSALALLGALYIDVQLMRNEATGSRFLSQFFSASQRSALKSMQAAVQEQSATNSTQKSRRQNTSSLTSFVGRCRGQVLPEGVTTSQRVDAAAFKSTCQRLGTVYGGFELPRDLPWLGPNSVVYCVGVGQDMSFDVQLAALYGSELHLFDPTPSAIQHFEAVHAALKANQIPPRAEGKGPMFYKDSRGVIQEIAGQVDAQVWFRKILSIGVPADRLHLHTWGMAASSGLHTFYVPVTGVSHALAANAEGKTSGQIAVDMKTLGETMRLLGHDHVDFLKLDIEGEEANMVGPMLALFGTWPGGHGPRIITMDLDCLRAGHMAYSLEGGKRVVTAFERAGYLLYAGSGGDVTFVSRQAWPWSDI